MKITKLLLFILVFAFILSGFSKKTFAADCETGPYDPCPDLTTICPDRAGLQCNTCVVCDHYDDEGICITDNGSMNFARVIVNLYGIDYDGSSGFTHFGQFLGSWRFDWGCDESFNATIYPPAGWYPSAVNVHIPKQNLFNGMTMETNVYVCKSGEITLSGETYCVEKGTERIIPWPNVPVKHIYVKDGHWQTTTVDTSDSQGAWSAVYERSFWEGTGANDDKSIRPDGGIEFPHASQTDSYCYTRYPAEECDNGIECIDSNVEGIRFNESNQIFEAAGCVRPNSTTFNNSEINFNLGYCPVTVTPTPTPTPTSSPTPTGTLIPTPTPSPSSVPTPTPTPTTPPVSDELVCWDLNANPSEPNSFDDNINLTCVIGGYEPERIDFRYKIAESEWSYLQTSNIIESNNTWTGSTVKNFGDEISSNACVSVTVECRGCVTDPDTNTEVCTRWPGELPSATNTPIQPTNTPPASATAVPTLPACPAGGVCCGSYCCPGGDLGPTSNCAVGTACCSADKCVSSSAECDGSPIPTATPGLTENCGVESDPCNTGLPNDDCCEGYACVDVEYGIQASECRLINPPTPTLPAQCKTIGTECNSSAPNQDNCCEGLVCEMAGSNWAECQNPPW